MGTWVQSVRIGDKRSLNLRMFVCRVFFGLLQDCQPPFPPNNNHDNHNNNNNNIEGTASLIHPKKQSSHDLLGSFQSLGWTVRSAHRAVQGVQEGRDMVGLGIPLSIWW